MYYKSMILFCTFAMCVLCFAVGFQYGVTKQEPDPKYNVKLEVVNFWEGEEGKVVGTLYANTEVGKHPNIWFIHEGGVTRYGGHLAWEALARAMSGKGEMIQLKVEPLNVAH